MKFRNISGFNKRMESYVTKNSNFRAGKYIGCKKSDGLLDITSFMYKKEEIEGETVFLFKYQLKDNKYCYEEVQCIENNILFIQLRKPEGGLLKWSKKERRDYIDEVNLKRLAKAI